MLDPKLRVLAAADDNMTRRGVAAMAKAAGIETVHVASDGKVAFEILLSSPVDFIISDWDMPRLDGLELLRAIRNKPVFKLVPFLIVSADKDPGAVTEAEEYGADGHLPKPFTQNLVESRVQEIIETRASLLPFHTLLSRASAFADIGALEDASKELSDLRSMQPKNAGIWVETGEVYQQMSEHDAAKGCYKTAIAIDEKFVRAYDLLGVILLKEGKTDEALEAIRFATRISPRNRDRHQLMGKILLARGDTEGARNAFHLSVARSPSKGSQSAAVAELFFISGRADLAEEEYNAAIEAEPDNMRFYNRRGIVLRRQRKHKEAIDNYRLAQKLSPRDSVVCYNLARAYIDLKNFDQAAIALERAIALDPEFEEAITALERLEERKASGPGDSPEDSAAAPETGRQDRAHSRVRMSATIVAPTLSRSPLIVEDVSGSGLKVVVSTKPEKGSRYELCLQVSDVITDRCQAEVAWVEENATDPLTWTIGIALDLSDEEKKRFGELLREKSPQM